mgnify:CR=1 FL=1
MFREFFRKIMAIVSTFSPTLTSKIYYEVKLKKKLDLKNPKTFNEKLMWLKLNEYENNKLITQCADKYNVRKYVEECGCKEILNELIGVYDTVEEIDFNKLPNKFVLKCNHAAGYNIICQDKSKLDINKTRKKLKKWLKNDYWKYVAELQYKNIEKKVICEKFLDSKDGNAIEDYKIYCFNGEPLFCMVCIGRNLGKPQYYFMDKQWKLMRINPAGISAPCEFKIDKPNCIDEMYMYAKKLSKPFKFVRVDFYDYNGKTIFGELTYTPAGCIDGNYSDSVQEELGKKIQII